MDAIRAKLMTALQDVPWSRADAAVADKVRELRTMADVSTGITTLAAFIFKKKPRSSGTLNRAITQWDHATAPQRRTLTLNAWRAANPAWAHHPDHDPYPKGPRK